MLVQKLKLLHKISSVTNNILIVPAGFIKHKVQPILIDDVVAAIEKLCTSTYPERIINLVGPEEVTFSKLIRLAKEGSKKSFKIIEIPETMCRAAVKGMCWLFKSKIINYDQYQLLFSDNIAEETNGACLLGRRPSSTIAFWEEELN